MSIISTFIYCFYVNVEKPAAELSYGYILILALCLFCTKFLNKNVKILSIYSIIINNLFHTEVYKIGFTMLLIHIYFLFIEIPKKINNK